ncbi:hypothetical protein D3C76_1496480 [compost metagenome]
MGAEVDQVILVIVGACRQDKVDAHGRVEFVAVVETDHRAQVSVTDAALVIVWAIVDVQSHVVERQ